MKKYNITLHLSNIRDALSVSIPAASLEDALAQIHAGDGVKLEAKEESLPGRCYDVSRVYIENIHVPADKLGKIYACIFGKGDRDEVISETAVFPDGMEMDVKCCGEEDSPGWTKAVLFRHGCECGCTDCGERFEGVWKIRDDDVMYVTVVVPESSPWLSPNIVTIPGSCLDSNARVIAHQTNCQGVMGAGVALAIRERYPEIMPAYQEACSAKNMLGKCQFIRTNDGHFIANLFGQDGIGCGRQTDYKCLRSALSLLVEKMKTQGLTSVSMPYNLGCGLAGGDWEVVREMLREVFEDTNIRLELWKL